MTRTGYTVIAAVVVVLVLAAAFVGVFVIMRKMSRTQKSLELANKVDTVLEKHYAGKAHIGILPEPTRYQVAVEVTRATPQESLVIMGVLDTHLTSDEMDHIAFSAKMRGEKELE